MLPSSPSHKEGGTLRGLRQLDAVHFHFLRRVRTFRGETEVHVRWASVALTLSRLTVSTLSRRAAHVSENLVVMAAGAWNDPTAHATVAMGLKGFARQYPV
jgi:hypothetical protein